MINGNVLKKQFPIVFILRAIFPEDEGFLVLKKFYNLTMVELSDLILTKIYEKDAKSYSCT